MKVKVIAGKSMGVESPVYTRSPTMYLDFRMEPKKTLVQEIPRGWNAFVYTLEGSATFGGNEEKAGAHHTLLLENNEGNFIVRSI